MGLNGVRLIEVDGSPTGKKVRLPSLLPPPPYSTRFLSSTSTILDGMKENGKLTRIEMVGTTHLESTDD